MVILWLREVFVWFQSTPHRLSVSFLYRFTMVLQGFRLVLIVPSLVHRLSVSFSYGFRMVLIVRPIGPSTFGVVFVWSSYGFIRFSYGFNRAPRWCVGFRCCFRIGFLWFSYGFNRPTRWSIGFRACFRIISL